MQKRLPLYRVYGVAFALWVWKGPIFDSMDVCPHAALDLFANVGEMSDESDKE